MQVTLLPAYGHDYHSQQEVLTAFNAGADFRIMDMSHPGDGQLINMEQLQDGDIARIRYLRKTRIVHLQVQTGGAKIKQ